jgi:hypothetical protein
MEKNDLLIAFLSRLGTLSSCGGLSIEFKNWHAS